MSRRLYFKVDVDMPDHPKIEALSDRAFRELIRLWAWCWKHDTDGEITPARWRKLPPKVRNELINGELVDEVHSVLMVHDYLDYQQSSEERRKASGGHAKGGSLGMHNRWHAARGVVKEGCPYCEETPPNQDQQHDNSSYNSTYNSEITEKEKEEEYKYLSTRQPVRNARARHGVSGPHSTRAIRLVDRTLGRGLTSATRTALAIEVAALLSEVDEPTLIAALQRWDSRTGIGPRLLPSLVDDIRKEARGATTRAAAGPSARPSTTDQRVAAAQALKARFASHAVHAIDGATVLQLPSGDMR